MTFTPTITVLTQGEQRDLRAIAPTDLVVTDDARFTVDDPAVATVDAAGTIQTVAVGTTRVDVQTDAARWSTLVTVAPFIPPGGRDASPLLARSGTPTVASITITTGTSLMEVGQQVQFQATARDARGNVLPNAVVTWVSSASSIIGMTSTGRASSVAPGEALLIAQAGSVARAVRVTSEAERIRSVRVTPATVSLMVGESVQLVATPLNLSGLPIMMPPGVRCTFTSSAQTVMRSNLDGLLFAITAGSAAITASCMDRSAQVPATVVELPPGTAPPSTPGNPPPGGPAPAPPPPGPNPGPTPGPVAPSRVELPRVWLDTMVASARSAAPSRTVTVRSSSEFQSALDNAQFGDELVLTAGTTYTGNFILRRRPGGPGWITIRSSSTALPAAGTRVRPVHAAQMPKLVSPNGAIPVIDTEVGAAGYRFVGIEMTMASSETFGYALVRLGQFSAIQSTLASQPTRLVLDRVYVHGHAQFSFQRCIELNSASTAIVDSWISQCHGRGFDSQAICGWNGSGPFMIHNNYLEGAGENVMFGGADSKILNVNPSDIDIRRNHLYKPPAWRTQGWTVKNIFELKAAERVLFEGNVLEENWAGAQVGFAIVLKATNQDNTHPWATTRNVTYRNNILRNSAHGIDFVGHQSVLTTQGMSRIYVKNNLFDRIGTGSYPGGRLWEILDGSDIILENNTGFTTNQAILFDQLPIQRLEIIDNVFGLVAPVYGTWDFAISGSGKLARAALDTFAPGWKMTGNVLPGGSSAMPTGNSYPATIAAIGFTAWSTNLRLSAGSAFVNAGTGGRAPGVDFDVLDAATAGVVVAP